MSYTKEERKAYNQKYYKRRREEILAEARARRELASKGMKVIRPPTYNKKSKKPSVRDVACQTVDIVPSKLWEPPKDIVEWKPLFEESLVSDVF